MKKLAIIDNSLWPEIYNPVEHWTAYLDLPYRAFRAVEGYLPDLDDGYTHLIVTGSEASIVNMEPWVLAEADLVQEAVERDLAVLGSCYGHQLLALALAGPRSVRRAARPEIGWIEVEILRSDPLLGPAGRLHVFSSHYDEVYNLDESRFEILAASQHCPVQAFRLKGKKVWGLQAHPEIDPVSATKLLRGMRDRGFSATEFIAQALATKPRDDRWIETISRNFAYL
ncbi:MAG: gamma-glutamyl-gamma-aminobutyrate hydrolase family protein [Candidatus Aminicenantes bacterium]|nr:gamma-glutamyl-gamma-aminobutyrate hydrolase family protein [Candidatus Aminicenantes bacterium]